MPRLEPIHQRPGATAIDKGLSVTSDSCGSNCDCGQRQYQVQQRLISVLSLAEITADVEIGLLCVMVRSWGVDARSAI